MEKKIEEKQPVVFSKQPIVKLESQGFVVLSIFVLFYFGLFYLISSYSLFVNTNRGKIWCLCCLTNYYNSAIILFLIYAALLVCMKMFFALFWLVFLLFLLCRKLVDV